MVQPIYCSEATKLLQRVSLLNTVGNCNTMFLNIDMIEQKYGVKYKVFYIQCMCVGEAEGAKGKESICQEGGGEEERGGREEERKGGQRSQKR